MSIKALILVQLVELGKVEDVKTLGNKKTDSCFNTGNNQDKSNS
jgi:hypothetical protein